MLDLLHNVLSQSIMLSDVAGSLNKQIYRLVSCTIHCELSGNKIAGKTIKTCRQLFNNYEKVSYCNLIVTINAVDVDLNLELLSVGNFHLDIRRTE